MPYKGQAKFEVEFHGLDWKVSPGSKLGINNRFQFQELVLPVDFGPNKNMLEVDVSNGEGQITIEKKIVAPETSLTIRAPAVLTLIYPIGHLLYTCHERTKGKCGGDEMGKYHKDVQAYDWTRFNFIVDGD